MSYSLTSYSYLVRDVRGQRRGRSGEARNERALRFAKRASRRAARREGERELNRQLFEAWMASLGY